MLADIDLRFASLHRMDGIVEYGMSKEEGDGGFADEEFVVRLRCLPERTVHSLPGRHSKSFTRQCIRQWLGNNRALLVNEKQWLPQ